MKIVLLNISSEHCPLKNLPISIELSRKHGSAEAQKCSGRRRSSACVALFFCFVLNFKLQNVFLNRSSENIPLKNLQISIFLAHFSHNLFFFPPYSVIFQGTKLKKDTLPVSDNRLLLNKLCSQNIPTLFPEVATTLPNIPTAIPNIPTNLHTVATTLPKVATNRPMIPTSLQRIPTNRPNIPTSVGMICKRVGKAGNLVGITNHRVGTISKRVGILSKQVGMINMLVGNRGNQVVNASKEVGMAGKQVGVNNWH